MLADTFKQYFDMHISWWTCLLSFWLPPWQEYISINLLVKDQERLMGQTRDKYQCGSEHSYIWDRTEPSGHL